MKLKRKLEVLVLLALFVGAPAFGQIGNTTGTANTILRITGQYKDTDGTPYLIEDYKNGVLYDKNGKARTVFLKYDTYKEEVEVFNEGNPLLIDKRLYPRFVIEYVDTDSKEKVRYEFTNEINIPGLKPDKYVQIVVDGDQYKLIKTYDARLLQSQDQGYGGVITNNYFDNEETYFIYTVGLDAVEIKKLKNRVILDAMSDDGTIKSWLKENRVKVRDEKDMVELINYLNSEAYMD